MVAYAKTEAERLGNIIFIFMTLGIHNIFRHQIQHFRYDVDEIELLQISYVIRFLPLFPAFTKMFSDIPKEINVLEFIYFFSPIKVFM